MSARSKLRGHEIVWVGNAWFYSDTIQPTRRCGHCGKDETPEGHDACLGTLIGVMNACCGHGRESGAYIQFLDGNSIHGADAVIILNVLKRNSTNDDEHTPLTSDQVGLIREFMKEKGVPIRGSKSFIE